MPEYETTKPVSVIRGHDVLLTQIAHRSRYFPKLAGTHGSHGWDFMSPLAPRRVEQLGPTRNESVVCARKGQRGHW